MGADYTGKNKMDLGLKGRNGVVLGGTRGIGRAIAGTLAGEGASSPSAPAMPIRSRARLRN